MRLLVSFEMPFFGSPNKYLLIYCARLGIANLSFDALKFAIPNRAQYIYLTVGAFAAPHGQTCP